MSAPRPLTKFAYPEALERFALSPAIYLATNPTLSGVIVSGVVVHEFSGPCTNDTAVNRVLVVQRAATDGFPLLWETPGGGVDGDDESILTALQRELMEETGLVLTGVVDVLDEGTEWEVNDGARWRKVTFLVTVRDQNELHGDSNEDNVAGKDLNVILNGDEHSDYVWASKDEIECEQCQGRNLVFAYKDGKEIALCGLRRAEIPNEIIVGVKG